MRIDNLTPSQVKSKSGARIAPGSGTRTTGSVPAGGAGDRVSLSNLALLAGGADAGRIEQLHGEVAARTYSVPALTVSRRIVDYTLAG